MNTIKQKTVSFNGMSSFIIVWIGQFFSVLGTRMTDFALALWAYETTGQVTALALIEFFSLGATVLFSPLAGAFADRKNRKTILILSDLGSGISTFVIVVLLITGNLQVWHIYILRTFSGAFSAFQGPAFSASITLMVPKEQYTRASSLQSLSRSSSGILAPIIAGGLVSLIGLSGIIFIDFVTFIFAVGTLFVVFIPQPPVTAPKEGEKKNSLWQDALFGFRYIFQRTGLAGLLTLSAIFNFIATLAYIVLIPLILARTDSNEALLGTILASGALGSVVGGIVLSAWGGPKTHKVRFVVFCLTSVSILGYGLMGVSQNIFMWSFANFLIGFGVPMVSAPLQSIWQSKVEPNVQGRVFATRYMLAVVTAPIAIALAGPLADYIFEPMMTQEGLLSPLFGKLVGTGAGAGIALLLVLLGVLSVFIGLAIYAIPAVRQVEDLPDFDAK